MQQHSSDLIAEAQRQFLICSACRYCEGYCATFPAIESRAEYTAADIAYVANVCHDCRACYQACMYTAPHEFAVDIPKLLTAVRLDNYRERALPQSVRSVIGGASGTVTLIAALVFISALLAAIALSGRWPLLAAADGSPGAFYRIVPFLWMVVPAFALSVWALFALWLMGSRLVRDVVPNASATLSDVIGAWKDGLALTYMDGGGAGCYYPKIDVPSQARRIFHVTLVAGVGLAFLATVTAAIMQHTLDIDPPYSLLSIPVVSGTLGGIAILIGGGGLLALKAGRSKREDDNRGMLKLELVFLWTLLAVALTGLGLLALRGTALLGPLLVVHLATVGALFLTAPYGKFVHVPLRLAALLIFRMEEAGRIAK
jgi:citrate/tricarballylate utilization protein